MIEDEGFFELDQDLKIKKISDVKFSARNPENLDVDLDGNDEILILAPDQKKHILLRHNFSYPVDIDLQFNLTILSSLLN